VGFVNAPSADQERAETGALGLLPARIPQLPLRLRGGPGSGRLVGRGAFVIRLRNRTIRWYLLDTR
ncbi:MAG: hypothetical protein ACLQVD_11870, partial [Capsulimonadaceae bacterium]